jgi:hypothetical protein
MSKRRYRFGLVYVFGSEKAAKQIVRLFAELGYLPSLEPIKENK